MISNFEMRISESKNKHIRVPEDQWEADQQYRISDIFTVYGLLTPPPKAER